MTKQKFDIIFEIRKKGIIKMVNTTIGLTKDAYEKLCLLSVLCGKSKREYLSGLIRIDYDKNEKSILKLKEVLDLEKKSEVSA